jgi:hypothetical protein
MGGLSMIFRPAVERDVKDVIRYNPARDLAYNYKEIWLQVAVLLEERMDSWPDFVQVFRDKLGVTIEELAAPMKAMADFLVLAESDITAMPAQVLSSIGWDRLRPEAKLALQAALGYVVTGMMFFAIRERGPGTPWPKPAATAYLAVLAGCFADFAALPSEERAKLTAEDDAVRVPARKQYIARLQERMGVPSTVPFPLPYISTGEAATC